MSDQGSSPLAARMIDWQEPLDDAAIARPLDSMDLENPDLRREVLETLDVLAERLVGRQQSADTGLKARIRAMRRAVTERRDTGAGESERSLSPGPAPDNSAPLDQGHR